MGHNWHTVKHRLCVYSNEIWQLGFCLSPLSQVMSRYLTCTYCQPQSLSLCHPCFWVVVSSLSSIQETVLPYASGWCLSIFCLWECSPDDNHLSVLLLSIQHGSEILCLVLQCSQIGYRGWKDFEFEAEVVALHLLRLCAFLPWRARPGLKCVSYISTLPGPGFHTNSECCASLVLQELHWYWCLTVLFNSLSLLFSHLHCFKQFIVSAEIQWGEFALTFICSCWHLISVQSFPFTQLPQSC